MPATVWVASTQFTTLPPSMALNAPIVNPHAPPHVPQYKAMYKRSIEDPDGFWAEVAEEFHWEKKVRGRAARAQPDHGPDLAALFDPAACACLDG